MSCVGVVVCPPHTVDYYEFKEIPIRSTSRADEGHDDIGFCIAMVS